MVDRKTLGTKIQKDGRRQNLSYIVVPIQFSHSFPVNDLSVLSSDTTIWEYNDKIKLKKDYLYEHIHLNKDNSANNLLLTYSIKKNPPKDSSVAHVINKVWGKLRPEMQTADGQKFQLDFLHEKGNWNGANLIFSPSSCTGLLVLCVNPKTEKPTLDEVIDFNYHLRKIDGQQKLTMTLDDNGEDLREVKLKELQDIKAALLPKADDNVDDGIKFKLTDIVRLLLSGLPEWKLLEQSRAHVFTYYCIEQDSLELSDDIKQRIIRLTRCENPKYNVPVSIFSNSGSFLSTFKNIHMGSSTQGGCIVTVVQKSQDGGEGNEANGFIKEFVSNLPLVYLWLYFMALMQRYVLLHMIEDLSSMMINTETAENRKDFNNKIRHFSNIKVKGLFKNVSSFTQHNQYYKFLLENMEVTQLYAEFEDKMHVVDSYLQMEHNSLTEERNELEKNIERRLQQEKEKEERRLQQEKEDKEYRVTKFTIAMTILAAALTLFQNAVAIKQLFDIKENLSIWLTILGYVIILIVIIWYSLRKK